MTWGDMISLGSHGIQRLILLSVPVSMQHWWFTSFPIIHLSPTDFFLPQRISLFCSKHKIQDLDLLTTPLFSAKTKTCYEAFNYVYKAGCGPEFFRSPEIAPENLPVWEQTVHQITSEPYGLIQNFFCIARSYMEETVGKPLAL